LRNLTGRIGEEEGFGVGMDCRLLLTGDRKLYFITIYFVLFKIPILSNNLSATPFFRSRLAVAEDKSLNVFIY
jgi:hypothetical protein